MGGSPSNITQTNKIELSPEQKELYGLMMPSAREFAAKDLKQFPGSAISPFDPSEIAGQETALGAAEQASGLTQKATAAQSQLLDPGFMLNPNQYLAPAADAVRRQASDVLDDSLRSIRGAGTTSGGQYSGGATKGGVQSGVATGRTAKGVSDAVAKMYLDNYQQGLSGLQGAVKSNADVVAQNLLPAQIQQTIGAQRRAMQQALKSEEEQRFLTEQDLPYLQAKGVGELAGAIPTAGATSTVRGAGGNPLASLLGPLLGSFLMPGLGSIGGAMGSGMVAGK